MYRVSWIEMWGDDTKTEFAKFYKSRSNAFAIAWQLANGLKHSRRINFWNDVESSEYKDTNPHKHFKVNDHEFKHVISSSVRVMKIEQILK